MKNMDHLLRESAPLALWESKKSCDGCGWYHGTWQYLRILGAVSPPYLQEEFYREVIEQLARSGDFRRVCISGSADYAMLDLVLGVWNAAGKTPEITVVDRCPTPLFLNRWYAERKAVKIRTICRNMLEYRDIERFDLICTHAFFGNFDPEQRKTVIRNWQGLLRPGGRVVTTNRIRATETKRLGFSRQQAADFVAGVRRARQRANGLDLSEGELAELARAYADNYGSYPVSSAGHIHDLFMSEGFVLERFETTGREHGVSGPPSTPGRASRVNLVAAKV